MVDLPRSEQALKVCRQHALEAQKVTPFARWAQVEAVLASYVASTIYAEAESCVREVTAQRVSDRVDDYMIVAFGKVAALRLIRSIKISELGGILGHFDPGCKAHFTDALTAKQKSDWDSLIGARHGVAHEPESAPNALTLRDVEGYFGSVHEVIGLFGESLEVELNGVG